MAFFHLLLLFLLSFSSISYAQSLSFTPVGAKCDIYRTIIRTPQISTNIDIVLKKLITTTPINGYGVAAAGKVAGVDKFYGLAQCTGDVNMTNCSLCIQDAAKQIRKRCTQNADAIIWYDSCFLRYDMDEFYGQVDTDGGFAYYNYTGENDVLDRKVRRLMNKLDKAAIVPSNKGFAYGRTKVSGSDSFYGMVQCSRDLSPPSCAQCLDFIVVSWGSVCATKYGCRIFHTSCYARYESYPFLDIASNEN